MFDFVNSASSHNAIVILHALLCLSLLISQPFATRIYQTMNTLDARHIRAEDRFGRLMRLIAGEQWPIREGTNGSFEVRRLRP